jgi:hypothetical protein
VPDLVRDQGLKLLGLEQIECRLRDQHDRARVQGYGGLGHVDDLDHVDSVASVQLEDAPDAIELASLGPIEVADLAFRRKRGENDVSLARAHGSGTNRIESLDDSGGVIPRKEVKSGFQGRAVRGGYGGGGGEEMSRHPRRATSVRLSVSCHGPTLGAGHEDVLWS